MNNPNGTSVPALTITSYPNIMEMAMSKLVKLVRMKEHAEMLLQGSLFMRPAAYFHYQEKGRRDKLEGIITMDNAIYTKAECPIYCMCSFCDNDIVNGYMDFSKLCIDEFDCFNGFAVVLDWQKFEDRIPSLNCNGHKCVYGRVEYKISRGSDDYISIIESENKGTMKSLFIKHPRFAYQREYRIAVDEAIITSLWGNNDEHIVYNFPMDLKDIGYAISIPDYLAEDGSLHIPIHD